MGESYSIEKVNLAELHRITGISRAKLRRLKKNGFVVKPNANKGKNPRNLLFQDTRAQLMIISERMSQIPKLSLKDFKESAIQESDIHPLSIQFCILSSPNPKVHTTHRALRFDGSLIPKICFHNQNHMDLDILFYQYLSK